MRDEEARAWLGGYSDELFHADSIHDPPHDWVLIAEHDEVPVGMLHVYGERGDDGLPFGFVCILVSPGHRGRGYGAAMLRQVMTYGLPFRHLQAHVDPDNHVSLATVRSCGWTDAGTDGLYLRHVSPPLPEPLLGW